MEWVSIKLEQFNLKTKHTFTNNDQDIQYQIYGIWDYNYYLHLKKIIVTD